MATAPADALPLWYPPQVTTLQQKLDFAVYRKRFRELLARVGSVVPLGFANSEPPLIELRVAWRECVRRDAQAVAVIPEGHMGNAGRPTLGSLARRHLSTPKEGFLSIFEAVPEHNRMFVLGDQDRKDHPIRQVLYPEQYERRGRA
jgi:hypothetical protein